MTRTFPTPTSARLRHGARAGRVVAVALALGLTASASAGVIRVRRGDTLSELARKHGTTVAALRELNRLGGNNLIVEGQTLRVSRVPVVAKATRPVARWVEVTHVVVPGDSLIKIAARYRQTPEGIAKRNRLPRSRIVRLGQRLVVGSRRVVASKPATAPAAVRRKGAPSAVPRARVRALIEREARKRRVDPRLAVALAWQESGLQHDLVSSAGALGAMQVMPGTGAWVSRYLAKRPLDLHKVEDNVEAGVRYLAQLLRVAPSLDTAIAGYYQGLQSVRTRGMYDDTERYVRNIHAIRRRLAKGHALRT
ncbi:MAG TPA: LysM peptidoglycan-binding domain-containing protein [Mycobacteriales bacterium]|nr:LysM peptidoglycan-binding domain-containing protein [Mycobacteriales bacterium]